MSIMGLETTISLGKQNSFAKPSTLNRQLLHVYSVTGGQTEGDTRDNILGGGLNNPEDPVAPAPGLDDHQVTIRGPICLTQIGFWLHALFGAEGTPGGSDPDYEHTFTSGKDLVPLFIEHRLQSGKFRQHYGCVAESLEIDWNADADGFAQFTAVFRGLAEDTASSVLTGTVTTAPALVRPAQKLVSITYDSVAGGDIMGGKMTYRRSLTRLRSADGTGIPYRVERQDIAEINGEIRTRFTDDDFYDDAKNKTAQAISLALGTSAARSLSFDLGNARLSRMPVDVGGPTALEYNPTFMAWQTSAAPALTVVLKNGSATAALPTTS